MTYHPPQVDLQIAVGGGVGLLTRTPWGGVNLLTRAPVGLKVELEGVMRVTLLL